MNAAPFAARLSIFASFLHAAASVSQKTGDCEIANSSDFITACASWMILLSLALHLEAFRFWPVTRAALSSLSALLPFSSSSSSSYLACLAAREANNRLGECDEDTESPAFSSAFFDPRPPSPIQLCRLHPGCFFSLISVSRPKARLGAFRLLFACCDSKCSSIRNVQTEQHMEEW